MNDSIETCNLCWGTGHYYKIGTNGSIPCHLCAPAAAVGGEDAARKLYEPDDYADAFKGRATPAAPVGGFVVDGIEEGCTPADAKVLRKANHAFADENFRLREALQFYADKGHFMLGDEDAWDTVSGEPPNFWCDDAGTATVEDGTIAKMTLAASPAAQSSRESRMVVVARDYSAAPVGSRDWVLFYNGWKAAIGREVGK